jgi:DNA polymerase-3 subunit beta
MEVTVKRSHLTRAAVFTEQVTAKNAALPILSNILFSAGGGKLRLSATNLELGVSVELSAKTSGEGRVAVPGKTFADLVRAAQTEVVTFSVQKNNLTAQAGAYHTQLLCFDPAEYPIIPTITGGVVFSIDAALLGRILASIADSIASSESRPELAGAYLRVHEGTITVAATDSFRLAEAVAPITESVSTAVIIPRATVSQLLRVLPDMDGEVRVRVADNQAVFSCDGVEVISRLIDGKYPDYRKVIPEQSASRVLVARAELENAIRGAALFSSSIFDVKLACTESDLSVSAKNASKGEGSAAISATLKGEPFDIAMNHHYLADGLKTVSSDRVVLEYTGKGSPFVVRAPEKDSGSVYIIMPLRA